MANISSNSSARRSRPTFQLVNVTEVVRKRYQMEKVKGRPVLTPIKPDLVIEGNVQPMKYHELLLLPESDRTKEWIVIYTDPEQDIRGAMEGDGGWPADEVVWQNLTYKVMRTQQYRMGVLDHKKVLAAREPISAGY